MNSLREQIKIKILAEKMAGKDVKVTDKQVEDYIAANKDQLKGTVNKEEIKQQLILQEVTNKIPVWIEGLQKKAKINYFI